MQLKILFAKERHFVQIRKFQESTECTRHFGWTVFIENHWKTHCHHKSYMHIHDFYWCHMWSNIYICVLNNLCHGCVHWMSDRYALYDTNVTKICPNTVVSFIIVIFILFVKVYMYIYVSQDERPKLRIIVHLFIQPIFVLTEHIECMLSLYLLHKLFDGCTGCMPFFHSTWLW